MTAGELRELLAATRLNLRNEIARVIGTLPEFIRRRFEPLLILIFEHLDAHQEALIELRAGLDELQRLTDLIEKMEQRNAPEESAGSARHDDVPALRNG